MTAIQNEWNKNQETIRHNREMDEVNSRNARELKRHNQEQEKIGWANAVAKGVEAGAKVAQAAGGGHTTTRQYTLDSDGNVVGMIEDWVTKPILAL